MVAVKIVYFCNYSFYKLNPMKIDEYLQSSPVFMLMQARQHLVQSLKAFLTPAGLGYQQALILISMQIDKKTQITPGLLSRSFGFPKARVSKMISELEKQGLVYRNIISRDARQFELFLSEEGARKANQFISFIEKFDAEMEKKIGAESLPNLLRSLNKILSFNPDLPGSH